MLHAHQIDGGPSGIYFEVSEEKYGVDTYIDTYRDIEDVLDLATLYADNVLIHTYAKWEAEEYGDSK